jgi:hypothetical protein
MSVRFIDENLIELKTPRSTVTIEVKELPKELIDWQLSARMELLEKLLKGDRITNFGSHLPVIVTKVTEGTFTTNAAIKGVGLVPKTPYLDFYREQFETIVKEEEKEERMQKGLELMLNLLKNPDKIDFRRFGSLEIFGGRTYKSILSDPRVTLHFSDFVKGFFVGYMINCVTQVFRERSPFYEFERAVRAPFLHAYFHLPIQRYLCAYSFWVCEVYEKTPGPKAGRRLL